MSKIVYVGNGTYLNMDGIQRIIVLNEKKIRVELREENYVDSMDVDRHFMESVTGTNFVVQIMPAKSVVAVYDNTEIGENVYCHPVEFFAVCANGGVRGMALFDGEIDFVDAGSNFKGYRHIDAFGNLLEG